MALYGDLMRIENDKPVPVRLADGSNVSLRWINDLLVTRDDSIWLAATDGIFQIKDGVLHNWCQENGLSQSTFYYMCEGDDGAIWAAQNTGIARFKSGGLRQITRKQGLHEDFVYAIVPDKLGNFWMDSNRGIFRVSQQELNAVADGAAERVHCSVYEGEDAVKTTDKGAQDYSGCRSLDGRIWFPSSKGIIVIDPANVPSNPQPRIVSVERVRINGRQYRPDQEPILEPVPATWKLIIRRWITRRRKRFNIATGSKASNLNGWMPERDVRPSTPTSNPGFIVSRCRRATRTGCGTPPGQASALNCRSVSTKPWPSAQGASWPCWALAPMSGAASISAGGRRNYNKHGIFWKPKSRNAPPN